MTAPLRFDQDLPILLDDLYVTGTPDYRDDLVRRLAATRQRPAWTFPGRWLPVELTTQTVPGPRMPWRTLGVLALIGLLLAAVAIAYVGSPQRLPAPFGPAANGIVVYSKGGDILVRDTVDSAPRILLGGPTADFAESISPLGRSVLGVRFDAQEAMDLLVVPVDGGDPVRIGGPYRNVNGISWSPDESRIAIAHAVVGMPRLTIVNADGSGERDLDVGMDVDSPSWRPPDGAQLSFRGQVGDNWGLFLVNPDGSGLTQVDVTRDLMESPYEVLAPAWSPTGDRIAFHRLVDTPGHGNGNGFRIHVAEVDRVGGVVQQDTFEFDDESDEEMDVAWMPAGDELVFLRHNDGTETLSIASPVRGARARDLRVTSATGEYQQLRATVAPDGRSVMVHVLPDTTDWVADPTTGEAIRTDIDGEDMVFIQRRAP